MKNSFNVHIKTFFMGGEYQEKLFFETFLKNLIVFEKKSKIKKSVIFFPNSMSSCSESVNVVSKSVNSSSSPFSSKSSTFQNHRILSLNNRVPLKQGKV